MSKLQTLALFAFNIVLTALLITEIALAVALMSHHHAPKDCNTQAREWIESFPAKTPIADMGEWNCKQ